jgi:hypothetical protein
MKSTISSDRRPAPAPGDGARAAIRVLNGGPGRLLLIALLTAVLTACSPESQRSRGGGPGSDVGNKDEIVEMHRGAEPYYRTPNLQGTPPVEEARR